MNQGKLSSTAHPPEELLLAYALDDLDAEQAAAVADHIVTCERCRLEVETYQTMLVVSAESVPQVEPPADLWNAIAGRLGEGESEALNTANTEGNSEPDELTLNPVTLDPVTYHPPARPTLYPWLMAACIALLVLTTGGGVWTYQTYQAYQAERRVVALVSNFLTQPELERRILASEGSSALGSVLVVPDDEALFVLDRGAPAGRVYQAWGHSSDDWEPSSGEALTSLAVSEVRAFTVTTAGFASLYLSVEPPGGSSQPTQAVSRVSLLDPVATAPLSITQPENGAVVSSPLVIISGALQGSVEALSYRLNGGAAQAVLFSGSKFSFTVADLQVGLNRVEVSAVQADGQEVTEVLELSYQP